MSTDFELFPGKNLSGLFEDIYNNQINKKRHISELIAEMKKSIRHAGDMAVLGPIIKDLVDSSVRNDDQLLKLATIAQRIVASSQRMKEILVSLLIKKENNYYRKLNKYKMKLNDWMIFKMK